MTPEPEDENGRRASSSSPLSAAKMFGVDQPTSFRPHTSDSDQPPSARFDGEDFLFHLYRGSELLQDNCVEQAKEELERALRMQPRDIEGQGLLGVVYFRLGLYPRAIEIYREIVEECPDEVTPKLNLSLCYFKTGQPADARDLLEEVIRRVPDHPRAWGYLGLVFERLGDFAKAETAFERAGQPHLARRMRELLEDPREAPSQETNSPREELRRAAADAVEELDAVTADPPFSRADPEPATASRAGRWKALEPGEELLPPLARPRRPPLIGRFGPAVPAVPDPTEMTPAEPRPTVAPNASSTPLAPETFVTTRRLSLTEGRAGKTREGLVLVEVRASLAVRSDRLRALSPQGAGFKASALKRRLRGRESDEPFGGAGSSWCALDGSGLVVLEPSADRELVLLELRQDFVYLREGRLVAFESSLRYENGRLPVSEPGPLPMVQLAGEGLLVFEARKSLSTLPVSTERGVSVRAACVLGWTGRLLGQAVPLGESPAQGTGFVAFSGDGAVLLDDP